MPRGTNKPSILFDSILKQSEIQLINESVEAGNFEHRGIKGDERASALISFLKSHLPNYLGIAKGEATDYKDNRSGQLDLIIYDKNKATPILTKYENILIPSEALYAVIEVKSIVTKDELLKCFNAAKKIRELRPFKGNFIASENNGKELSKKEFRCMYIVFGFQSNLSKDDWLEKEYNRICNICLENRLELNFIDRLIVLDRGILNLPYSVGKVKCETDNNLFLEFFLHLTNFLSTESKRRPILDWQMYASRSSKGWKKLNEPL